MSVPFLRVLKKVVDAGRASRTPVTLCGELAGRAVSAMALIGLGYRSISMPPAAIGPVKAMLGELPVEQISKLMDGALETGTRCDVRALLHAFAEEHSIPL